MRIGSTLCTVLLLLATMGLVTRAAEKPNVVLIYCDDLGYGDIGCFGSTKHRTPHIDRMAKEGMRLTSYYSTSGVCTPSRSSLMTGCYPRRVSMHQNSRGEWVLFPIAKQGLNPDEVTIAEVLKGAGYATACIGKWHLGDQPPFLPTKQGFDDYYGIPYSNDMGVRQRRPVKNPPLPLMRGEGVFEAPAEQTTLTKRYTEEVIKFIEGHREEPFFVYLPHTMPHNPIFSSERFAGKSANGRYGDAVEEIDWSTGEILKTLDRLKLDEKTLVIFTSDNGAASRWGGSNAPLRGFKGSTWEGGMRVCCVARWPGHVPADSECGEIVSSIDFLPTLAGLAGAKPPADRVIDGMDVWPLLSGKTKTQPRDAFYYYRVSQLQCVRSGKWKLHLAQPKRGRNAAREPALYDLDADVGETTDVAAKHPDVVVQLQQLAEGARKTLGDGNEKGSGQRPAGMVEKPTPRVIAADD